MTLFPQLLFFSIMAQKSSKNLKKLIIALSLSVIAVTLILIFGNSQIKSDDNQKNLTAAESMENIFYDQFFKRITEVVDSTGVKDGVVMEMEQYNDPNIIIADIDEKSLERLGNYYEWDRSIHAKVIENLSEGGAAAIAFDILFKNADFGKRKADQCNTILSELYPDTSKTDSITTDHFSQIRSYYNYDSMLVAATKKSNICIVSYLMSDSTSYKHKSDWYPLSTWERAKEIGFTSTFQISQADKPQDIEYRQLLDNVFPELAHAGARLGAVNAYPDKDGVIRRIFMLYKFPVVHDDKPAPHQIYSSISLMTILHLFHKDPKEVKIKMGEYIDIGKPFGIYRDSSGDYHTTYPNFTYPMFVALRDKMKSIKATGKKASQVETSSKISVSRNNDGDIVFDYLLDEDQHLNAELSNLLRKTSDSIFYKLEDEEKIKLGESFSLSKSEDDEGVYIITDENDEEISITPNILSTIHFFENSYKDIKKGEHKYISRYLDISYNLEKDKWSASIQFFTDPILKDVLKATDKQISSLEPGQELRFGPYKRIPIDPKGQFLIKYKGRFNFTTPETKAFKHVSYYDIYKDSTNLDQYAGKTIILGSSVAALFDIVNGPHEENIPAILVHASIIKNILDDDYMKILDEKYQRIIVILLALLFTFIGLYSKSFWSFFFMLIAAAGYIIVAYTYFEHNLYIGVFKQLLAIVLTNILAMVVQAYFENKEKRFITSSFKQYISPELIDELVADGITPQLGGEESVITAYFTDIQGFSTFSEKIGSASKLVELLNEYLSAMTDVLTTKNKGTLDKYEGDAIIAFFGAPMKFDDHARRACNSALDMQSELLRLRKKWLSEGNKWPKVVHDMHMRIGINTGHIVTGNMGSTMRKNYTMMGDEVNLAARLESAAKQYGAYIHVCKNTIDQLVAQGISDQYIYRSLDIIRVVGKEEPVETFEFLAYANDENAETLNKLTALWSQARAAYLNMEWDKAIDFFEKCKEFEPHLPERDPGSKTCPSMVYIKRCLAYKQNPPVAAGEKWDGIFTATEK